MRLRVRLVGVASLALVAAGCFWTAPGAGPDRTGQNVFEDEITPETAAGLEEAWTATVDEGSVRGPVTSDHAVHVLGGTARDPQIYGVDPDSGARLWATPPPGNPVPVEASPPIFSNGEVWFGYGSPSAGGQWFTQRLDPDTGDVVSSSYSGLIDSVRGSRYLVRSGQFTPNPPTGGTRIQLVDPEDPDIGWQRYIDVVGLGDSPQYSPLTLGNDHVYHAGPGFLRDLDGEDPDSSRGNGIRGYPIEEPCDQPDDLCPSDWQAELDGTRATSPVVAREEAGLGDATVYTGTDAGTVYAVDATNGDVVWSTPVGSAVRAEPALADGTLFVPTSGGGLVALDADDGDTLWDASPGDDISVQPAVAGGVVFVGNADGSVQAFDASGCGDETCDALWSDATGSYITGAPAVSNGQLYVGTADGHLIAYGLS